MKLPAEIINQIFEWNSSREDSIGSEDIGEYENSSKGYLINKYFTQQFFQNELNDIDFRFFYSYKNKGILQHSEMIKTLNCLHWEHKLQKLQKLPICFSNCSVLKCYLTNVILSNQTAVTTLFPNLKTLICEISELVSKNLSFIKNWTSLSNVHLNLYASIIADPYDMVIETVTSLELNRLDRNQMFVNQLSKCFPNCSKLEINNYITTYVLDLSTFDKLEDITLDGIKRIIFPKRLKKLRLSIIENTRVVFPDSISDYCEIIMKNRSNEQLVDILPIIKKALKYAILYRDSYYSNDNDDYESNPGCDEYDVVISNFVYPIWPRNKYKQIGNEFVFTTSSPYDFEDLDAFACHGESITSSIRELYMENCSKRDSYSSAEQHLVTAYYYD